ncbi:tyrosine-type recombinase/integrase [Halobiforma nitratireducens]|uniref:Integrase protein n=1 Tax=Halobiforma nitratireducens JCM 10879 TaxID=1227454 RepID=M0M029_9EURY|nr:site-specific integrase [Halobiforma nitratireducens]EMA39167.1 integrase protein [Halobiforma nitratireducens JCM 10879]
MHGQDRPDRTLDELRQLLQDRAPSLQPLAPAAGVDRYVTRRESEITPKTVDEYRRKLDYFLEFCEMQGIDDLNAFDGRLVDDYRVWRRDHASDAVDTLGAKTMRDEMYLFRSFLRYLESIEAVRPGLADRVVVPELGDRDGVRDVEIAPEQVAAILEYLNTHRYADREHVVWLLHCRTGRRPGAIQSLDVPDVHLEAEPYLTFRHRPGEGSRLKNGTKGEGDIAIMDAVAAVLEDYIEHHREPVTDEYGREPLLTSAQGRLSKSVMRRYFYKWSRPCAYTNECPHGEVIEACPAAQSMDAASKCPSSHASYATRHGHITQLRRLGVPKSVISDRCDVSEEIIDKHYDERTAEDRRQLQRDLFEQLHEQADEDRGYI